jgi:hypothetical protein
MVWEYTCDGCTQVIHFSDTDEVIGLQGNVTEVTISFGMGTSEWYACSRKCVAKAITNVLNRVADPESDV